MEDDALTLRTGEMKCYVWRPRGFLGEVTASSKNARAVQKKTTEGQEYFARGLVDL